MTDYKLLDEIFREKTRNPTLHRFCPKKSKSTVHILVMVYYSTCLSFNRQLSSLLLPDTDNTFQMTFLS